MASRYLRLACVRASRPADEGASGAKILRPPSTAPPGWAPRFATVMI